MSSWHLKKYGKTGHSSVITYNRMVQFPVIKTRRLLITPFAERHLTARYVGWLNDPDVVRNSEQRHKRHNMDTCRLYWQSFKRSPHYFWAIEEKENGLGHIGNINAYRNERHQLADVGIMIGAKDSWNKHYGLEAWFGVCHYLIHQAGVRKLTAGALSVNTPMIRLMHRAGMINDGIRARHYLCDDREVDVIHMALFKDQWNHRTMDREDLIHQYLKVNNEAV